MVTKKNPYEQLIFEASKKYPGVSPELIDAVIRQESAYNPKAQSSAGAQGLMQLMPATANELGVTDPYDPRQNIFGGTAYLDKMIRSTGSIPGALMAYNAGLGNYKKYKGNVPFKETQNYVKKIMSNLGMNLPEDRSSLPEVEEATGYGEGGMIGPQNGSEGSNAKDELISFLQGKLNPKLSGGEKTVGILNALASGLSYQNPTQAQAYNEEFDAIKNRRQNALSQLYKLQQGSDLPSDIRSFLELQKMSPEQREQFLRYKNAGANKGPSDWQKYTYEQSRKDRRELADLSRQDRLEREQRMYDDRYRKYSADMVEETFELDSTKKMLEEMKDLWKNVSTGPVAGKTTKFLSNVYPNSYLNNIADLQNILKSKMSRFLGQNGVLTEQDVKFVEKIMGMVDKPYKDIEYGIDQLIKKIDEHGKKYKQMQKVRLGIDVSRPTLKSLKNRDYSSSGSDNREISQDDALLLEELKKKSPQGGN